MSDDHIVKIVVQLSESIQFIDIATCPRGVTINEYRTAIKNSKIESYRGLMALLLDNFESYSKIIE